ncbi:FtsK/SpoIIIE domain-containing protein [Sinomonas atrocyanea]|uniref:FtsK/SpoIIIE domain-containing protein n=1 Tax=Sinomonas atrocyanea TaxID=37927 RepID=UPI00278B2B99|nr:FtsK/SpoIIIE domain-containing protein [Sinomonas atrocyanea]MDQ0258391.1 S-DNA-T family DNA segregation ATPase FtsK/SpoIIIE [Sinomonas atrocyanea]MDR6620660.1 S-DNA-T family DNA segregation ATPase FtsK/SpoIIIE [Sinomonas atrocyanea]
MELHCTLVSPDAGSARAGCMRRELVVHAADGSAGGEVAAALEAAYGSGDCTVEGVPLAMLVVGRAPLTSGAVLIASGADRSRSRAVPPPLSLVVHTGPAAGTVVPIGRGTLRLGRAPGGEGPRLALPDPELSREHALIEVTDAAAAVTDLGSANGVWVGGRRVQRAELCAGQAFRLGSCTCTLVFGAEEALLDAAAGSGPGAPLRVVRHMPPPRRAAIITMAALPLAVGVALALATGLWMFLAFTAVSAVSVLVPLIEGRSARRDFERRLAAAADDDGARRRARAPDLGLLARSSGSAGLRDGSDADPAGSPVHARLGTADQPADVVIEPEAARAAPPRLAAAPFTAPLRGVLGLDGGAESVDGLMRSLLLQLARLPAAAGLGIAVVGGADRLRLAARFLPRLRFLPAGLPRGCPDAALPGCLRGILLVLPGTRAESCAAAVEAAHGRGWPVVAPVDSLAVLPHATVRLDGRRSALIRDGTTSCFLPDLMTAEAFENAARRAGRSAQEAGPAGIPDRCGLDALVPLGSAGVAAAWDRSAQEPGVRFPVGCSAAGTVTLDLVAHGPHLLVAGTTGSGKSEFLRTLVAAAAATHSPARLTFLLVDFKGGSGLAPLAGLPHCVGLVTDLAEGGMDRTLASLRAELTRRERLLGSVGAADVVDYVRLGGDLPRLVLVVDEFRVLMDEAPAALAELMRIATVGRSLGMHLVMATQRPQGALSADIRANVTTSIALRMQHEAESSDVLGSPLAAHIPIGLPGRAYLAIGGDGPLEFQSASLGPSTGRPAAVRVTDARRWPDAGHGAAREGRPAPAEAAVPLVEAARRAWAAAGRTPVRKPVAPPLPPRLTVDEAAACSASLAPVSPDTMPPPGAGRHAVPDLIHLGLVDVPHEQRVARLDWNPGPDGHLALVGPATAGTADALAAVVSQLADGDAVRHLYLLDGDGSLGPWRGHPRVGAHVSLGDLRRAARVIARLDEECARRLLPGTGAHTPVPLAVVVSAWGAWISALRQSPQAWAEEGLGDLVRNGPAAGLSVVAAGERELVGSRPFAGMAARLFFPSGATEEARLSWPRLPAMPALAGRAAAAGTLIAGGAPLAAQCCTTQCCTTGAAAAGAEDPVAPAPSRRRGRGEPAPFRIDPLPALAPAALVAELAGPPAAAGTAAAAGRLPLVVGLAGDEPAPLSIRLAVGEVLLVLGAPGSGKSTLLAALPTMNPTVDFVATDPQSRARDWQAALDRRIETGPGAALAERTVLLVDDADQLDAAENRLLSRLLETGARIVATAGYSASLYARCPLALTVRGSGTGILIAPRTAGDGEVLGVRVDAPGHVPPGRGVALIGGRLTDVQLGVDGPRSEAAAP